MPIARELEPAIEPTPAEPHANVEAGSGGISHPRHDGISPLTLTLESSASRRASAVATNGGAKPVAEQSDAASFGRADSAETVATAHVDRIMNTLTDVLLNVRPPDVPARPKRAAAQARSNVDIELPLLDVVEVEYRPCAPADIELPLPDGVDAESPPCAPADIELPLPDGVDAESQPRAPADIELPLPDVVDVESQLHAMVDMRLPLAAQVEALPAHDPLIKIELPPLAEASAVLAPDTALTEPALALTPHVEAIPIDAAELPGCAPFAEPDPGALGDDAAATARRANAAPVSVRPHKRATTTGAPRNGSGSRPHDNTRKSMTTARRGSDVKWLRIVEQLHAAAAIGTRPHPPRAAAPRAASAEDASPAQSAP